MPTVIEHQTKNVEGKENPRPIDGVHFPLGLPGFEAVKNYRLLSKPEESPFMRLEMRENPRHSFMVAPAMLLPPDYQPDISDRDVEFLKLMEPSDAVLLAIVTSRQEGLTANLRGPIVLNRRSMVGKQVIPKNVAQFGLRHPIPRRGRCEALAPAAITLYPSLFNQRSGEAGFVHARAVAPAPVLRTAPFKRPAASAGLEGRSPAQGEQASGRFLHKFCQIPFVRFETLMDGKVAPCCSIWTDIRLGSIDTQSLAEIWNSPEAIKIRESIHDGSFRYCKADRCTFLVHDTLPNKSDITDPYFKKIIDEKKVVMERGPESLSLAHDVTCNLACPSCRSGMLRANDAQQARFDAIERDVLRPALQPGHPVELSVSGQGDPWASAHYRSILRHLADRHDLAVNLILFTNGLLMTERLWDDFRGLEQYHPHVKVSIDACNPWTYQVLRRPGRWDVLIKNLEFMGAKRRAGRFSQFIINATVQLDNFHELRSIVKLGQHLGCDGVRLSMIQNTGTHLAANYSIKNIANTGHLLHQAFLETLRDPFLADPMAFLYDVETIRNKALSTPSIFDSNSFDSTEGCLARLEPLVTEGRLSDAMGLVSRARWMFPDDLRLRYEEGLLLQALGFHQQATYRYREYLAVRPSAANDLKTLDTKQLNAEQMARLLRELVRTCGGVCGGKSIDLNSSIGALLSHAA